MTVHVGLYEQLDLIASFVSACQSRDQFICLHFVSVLLELAFVFLRLQNVYFRYNAALVCKPVF